MGRTIQGDALDELTYLREIKDRFRKKRVAAGAPTGELLTDPKIAAELFHDLQNEGDNGEAHTANDGPTHNYAVHMPG